ncbi:MAG: tetratricopeptide repeat protein [Bacteroidia bacterium]|nr:tetratricopeptide repeat protein [Bacteroidia bacterium]
MTGIMHWKKYTGILAVLLLTANLLVRCSQQSSSPGYVSEEIKYTGIQSCQPCHKKIYQSFRETGMGKSLYRPDTARIIEKFGPDVIVTDTKKDFIYHPYWAGETMFVKEFRLEGDDTTYQRTEKVDYVVGSGHQTRSYLIERNGYLYEVPITWYVLKQIWDMSPGYDVINTRFSREIGQECMGCHTGYADFIEGSKNRYRFVSEGIDCEKCHGPGEKHIQMMESGKMTEEEQQKTNYAIVNPGQLSLSQQFDICQQCHLQGVNVFHDGKNVADFRPGNPLSDTYDVFIERQADENAFGIASHAERLQQSRCFIAAEGKLTCTTCHNPHKSTDLIARKVYINQCTRCHEKMDTPECSAPEEEKHLVENDCISCHMPKGGTSDIPHVSFHDHKIRVVQPQPDTNLIATKEWLKLACATRKEVEDPIWGEAWLLYFERQNQQPEYLQKALEYSEKMKPYDQARMAFYRGDLSQALNLAESAIRGQPDDFLSLFLKGEILESQRRYAEAAVAYRQSFEINPAGIDAGLKSGVMNLRARQGDPTVLTETRTLFENLLKIKPFDERLLTNLGFVAMNQGDHSRAESCFVQALSYEPDNIAALENMILLQITRGNDILARKYFEHLANKHPDYPGLERLRQAL